MPLLSAGAAPQSRGGFDPNEWRRYLDWANQAVGYGQRANQFVRDPTVNRGLAGISAGTGLAGGALDVVGSIQRGDPYGATRGGLSSVGSLSRLAETGGYKFPRALEPGLGAAAGALDLWGGIEQGDPYRAASGGLTTAGGLAGIADVAGYNVPKAVAPGLSAASGGLELASGIQSGDPYRAASGGLSTLSGLGSLAEATGYTLPAGVVPGLGALSGGLGLAGAIERGDPMGIASNALQTGVSAYGAASALGPSLGYSLPALSSLMPSLGSLGVSTVAPLAAGSLGAAGAGILAAPVAVGMLTHGITQMIQEKREQPTKTDTFDVDRTLSRMGDLVGKGSDAATAGTTQDLVNWIQDVSSFDQTRNDYWPVDQNWNEAAGTDAMNNPQRILKDDRVKSVYQQLGGSMTQTAQTVLGRLWQEDPAAFQQIFGTPESATDHYEGVDVPVGLFHSDYYQGLGRQKDPNRAPKLLLNNALYGMDEATAPEWAKPWLSWSRTAREDLDYQRRKQTGETTGEEDLAWAQKIGVWDPGISGARGA